MTVGSNHFIAVFTVPLIYRNKFKEYLNPPFALRFIWTIFVPFIELVPVFVFVFRLSLRFSFFSNFSILIL